MKNENKIVGIKDVAKAANVALATVDRVIHNRTGVSKKTKEKVLKVIDELGYQPNIMASNLSKGKQFVFGVLLPKASSRSSYWEFPTKGVFKAQKELEQYRIKIETFLYDQDDNIEIRKQILKIINSDIDGLVLTSKFADEIEILLQDCKEKNRPYVFIDSNIKKKESISSIQQPLYESGQLAGQLFNYCFKEGEILILHLKDTMDSGVIIDLKVKGLTDYLNEKTALITTKKIVITNFNQNNIKTELDTILAKNPQIKGIFTPNSKIGYVAQYLTERNGEKIILTGYDLLKENTKFIENGIIDFLICQRPEQQGYQSIFKLFEHIVLRKDVEKEVIIPLDIVTSKNYKYY